MKQSIRLWLAIMALILALGEAHAAPPAWKLSKNPIRPGEIFYLTGSGAAPTQAPHKTQGLDTEPPAQHREFCIVPVDAPHGAGAWGGDCVTDAFPRERSFGAPDQKGNYEVRSFLVRDNRTMLQKRWEQVVEEATVKFTVQSPSDTWSAMNPGQYFKLEKNTVNVGEAQLWGDAQALAKQVPNQAPVDWVVFRGPVPEGKLNRVIPEGLVNDEWQKDSRLQVYLGSNLQPGDYNLAIYANRNWVQTLPFKVGTTPSGNGTGGERRNISAGNLTPITGRGVTNRTTTTTPPNLNSGTTVANAGAQGDSTAVPRVSNPGDGHIGTTPLLTGVGVNASPPNLGGDNPGNGLNVTTGYRPQGPGWGTAHPVGGGSLMLAKADVYLTESMHITYNGVPESDETAEVVVVPSQISSQNTYNYSLDHTAINPGSGIATLDAPDKPGTYDVRTMVGNQEIARVTFQAHEAEYFLPPLNAGGLSLSKTELTPGEHFNARYNGVPESDEWLGVIIVHPAVIAGRNTTDYESNKAVDAGTGNVGLEAPSATGNFEARLMMGDIVLSRVPIHVAVP